MKATRLGSLVVAVTVIGAAVAAPVYADSVLFNSRQGNNTAFLTGQEYVDNWNSLATGTPGYGSAVVSVWDSPANSVTNHDLIPGGSVNSIAYHYQVSFDVDASEIGNWDFRIAPDFGFGGTVLLDGSVRQVKSSDMWWSGSWGDSSQLFEFSEVMGLGTHTLDVYGQEFCCDGATAAQYSINGGNFTPFATDVPEPGETMLCLGGVIGLVNLLRRRRK
jgi:hypothetical protein